MNQPSYVPEITSFATRRQWRTPAGVSLNGWDFGGEGELALLHHANGLCAACWLEVAMSLRQRYRVVALDARGHGDSDGVDAGLVVPEDFAWATFVDDLIFVAENLLAELKKPAVALGVGSSFGGIITAAAEAKQPELFRHIVMLDPPINPTAELVEQMGVAMEVPPSARETLVAQTKKRKADWPDRATAYAAWRDKPLFAPWSDTSFQLYGDEGLKSRGPEVTLKCSPLVEAHIFATTGSLGVLEYAPHVRAPVSLVHASQGHFPREFYAAIANLFPNCRLHDIDAGHMLPLEAALAVSDLILAL